MPAFPRSELDEMVKRWIQANKDAQEEGNWSKHLGPFYTEDAVYTWNLGPNEEFHATGRQEITDIALGYEMRGFEDWTYPFHDVIIDDQRGTVIAFYKQVSPHKREDGTPYVVEGIGGSWFEYGGNFQWRWQKDFFDVGNVKSLLFELAGSGKLPPVVKKRIYDHGRGNFGPGYRRLRTEPGVCTKVMNVMAMIRIALIGR